MAIAHTLQPMDEVLSSLDSNLGSNQVIEIESIAAAMLSSASPEELLKIFLTTVGNHLAVNRVVIYQFINKWEGKILVEAISPNCQSIKNKIYPINYFGIDTPKNYPYNHVIALTDVTHVNETLAIHQLWQNTQVRSMMVASILLDISTNKIWGFAAVQQCDRVRTWQTQETDFWFKISQVLGQCLQYWQVRLQSSTFSQSSVIDQSIGDTDNVIEDNDQEEFVAKRIELSPDEIDPPIQTELNIEEIAISRNFAIPEDEENAVLSISSVKDSQTSINHAINLAMQKLDREMHHSTVMYLNDFAEMNDHQEFDDVDVESLTLEDILEDISQRQTQDKVEYLQQRVKELTESLQEKFDEVEELQSKIQELTESQQKFRQRLLDLQSKNLNQPIKDAVAQIYQALGLSPPSS